MNRRAAFPTHIDIDFVNPIRNYCVISLFDANAGEEKQTHNALYRFRRDFICNHSHKTHNLQGTPVIARICTRITYDILIGT